MNDDPNITMKFEGALADNHEIGMRHLGESLIGVEEILSKGLYMLDTGKLPKHFGHVPFVFKVRAPKQGSVDIAILIAQSPAFLPLLHKVYITAASDILWNWISGVLLKMSGKESEANEHIGQVVKLLDNVDARRHAEIMEWQKFNRPAQRAVTPIGPFCNQISLPHKDRITEIDLPLADAIRSKGKLEVGDMEIMTVVVDGFTHHNRQLRILLPEMPGRYLTAYVRDPAFDTAPNIYTEAATRKSTLTKGHKE